MNQKPIGKNKKRESKMVLADLLIKKIKGQASAKSILIAGISGTGKSSICGKLTKLGYKSYDIEEIEGLFTMFDKRTGKPFVDYDNYDLEKVKYHDWVCDKNKLQELVLKNKNGTTFYCGIASNTYDLLPLFDKVILLQASLEVIRKRLTERTTNDFGKTVEVQDMVLKEKDSWEKSMIEKGAIPIDANRSLAEMAGEIVEKTN